jgi:ComF family protein
MSLVASVKDVLFPAHCLACDRQLGRYRLPLLCEECANRLSPITAPLCSCCGIPFPAGENHLCGDCLSGRRPFDLARASFLYEEPLVSLIHRWKFGRQLTGLATMAHLSVRSTVISHLATPDLIFPVPLHTRRLRQRGFNQALLFAKKCFPDWGDKIIHDGLRRVRATIPQTTLTGAERRKNLIGAFSLRQSGLGKGKSVLLIDDVVTTGSTVCECSRVLRHCGAARVEIFTLARAL